MRVVWSLVIVYLDPLALEYIHHDLTYPIDTALKGNGFCSVCRHIGFIGVRMVNSYVPLSLFRRTLCHRRYLPGVKLIIRDYLGVHT
ncbi:MAG: hypothetical protein BWY80_01484 [Firmicutes bacterium ADurb.Bin456]|nr:MAG: hypothetical protein BWY80_01484 [Firmicutes bacterium ADurb.Bin456]